MPGRHPRSQEYSRPGSSYVVSREFPPRPGSMAGRLPTASRQTKPIDILEEDPGQRKGGQGRSDGVAPHEVPPLPYKPPEIVGFSIPMFSRFSHRETWSDGAGEREYLKYNLPEVVGS
eukprot:Skav230319  [mRNA]  locus=scaffold430:407563:407916:+ [translate_table: standard]